MKTLSEKLGYSFKNEALLETALTHPSYSGDHHVPHYQRLEFLGDAVLELVISRHLFLEYPDIDEGKLTRIRAALVREETLNKAAQGLELGKYIRLSIGEERTNGRKKPSILSDVMEAVFAAVYVDGGMECAERVILRVMQDVLRPDDFEDKLDAKSRLQEKLQSKGEMPEYSLIAEEGPPHAPVFFYRVTCEGRVLGEGRGTRKQSAQQAAARDALNRMERNLN